LSAVSVWYLHMQSPSELIAKDRPADLSVVEAQIKQYQFNRFLYQLVGATWRWSDKLKLSDAQWQDYAEADNLRTWVAWCAGSPAGYFELRRDANGEVELCYFGLAEKFIGRGFGGYLLGHALQQAWNWQASRVIVNTCSLDHPSALANYQARGMQIYKTEVVQN
jgi:GNAT superfamily N-acetyltransferase